MERQAVESSMIKSVGYSRETRILEIEFSNGSVHDYSDVPESEYLALVNADSIGKQFSAAIRGLYSGTKVV